MSNFGRLIGLALRQPLNLKNCQFIRCYCVEGKENVKQTENSNLNNETVHKKETPSSKFITDQLGLFSRTVLLNSFNLMTLISQQKIPLVDPKVLLKGLLGARIFRRDKEFLNFYDEWWQLITKNIDKFTVESICEILSLLGDMNDTEKTIRRKVDRNHISFLLSKILEANFETLPPRAITFIFNGLQRLQTSVDGDDFVPKELISKTVNWLNSSKKDDILVEDAAVTGVLVLCSLAKLGYSLDQNALQTFLSKSKTLFERISTLTEFDLKYYFAYNRLILVQNRFAEAFLKWQINADEIISDVWKNWFAATMNLMIISSKFEALPKYDPLNETYKNAFKETDDDETIQLKKFYHKQNFASFLTLLCSSAAVVASKFKKLDLFTNEEFRKNWKEILEKHVPDSNTFFIQSLSTSLLSLEKDIRAKSSFDGEIKEENTLVSDELMTIIRQKLEENKKKIAQKNQRKNSWKSFEEKIVPSRDFGGGFREFRGQRFERRDGEKRQYFYERREGGTPSRSDGRRKTDDQRQQKFSDGSGDVTYKESETDYSTFSGRPSRFSRVVAAASSRKRADDFDETYDDEPRNRRSGRASVDFDDDDGADVDSSDDRRFRRFRKADARMDDSLDEDFSPKSRSRIVDDDEDFEVERRPVGRGRRRKYNRNDYVDD